MKKLWLLIFVFIPFTNVFAITTYYSDYRPYITGTEEVLNLDDTLMKEEYQVYNTAVINEYDQGYVEENVCNIKVPDDTKIEYTVKARTSTDNRWYQSMNLPNGYINKITLHPGLYITISEVKIYNGDTQVSTMMVDGTDETNKLVDNDISTYYRLVPNNTYTISFIPIVSNKLKIKFISTPKFNGSMDFIYTDNTSVYSSIYADEIDVRDSDYLESIKPIVGTNYAGTQLNSYEKEEKVLFHCIKREKVKTGNYKKESDIDGVNESIDHNDSKTIYDYYKRDKVKISDKQITSSNYNLKDLVTLSTVDDFRVEDNIDYSKNGTYQVKFIFGDDFIVEKDVVINIAKNNKTTTTTTVIPVNETTTTTSTKQTTTKVTSTTKKLTTTVPITTTTNVVTTTTKSISTTTKKSSTTTTVKANNVCPTYEQDDEVIQVEPLKATIEKKDNNEEQDNNKRKLIFKIIMLIIIILIVILYIIYRCKEKDKESC